MDSGNNTILEKLHDFFVIFIKRLRDFFLHFNFCFKDFLVRIFFERGCVIFLKKSEKSRGCVERRGGELRAGGLTNEKPGTDHVI